MGNWFGPKYPGKELFFGWAEYIRQSTEGHSVQYIRDFAKEGLGTGHFTAPSRAVVKLSEGSILVG